jgi:threonine dehydratase
MIDPTAGEEDFVSGVRAATGALRAIFEPTPLQRNDFLSDRWGGDVWLKREDLTPVRSYKIRGAFNAMRKVLAGRGGGAPARFVCASAGNHAQGMAFACRHFDVAGVVFMPVTTPQQKIDKTRQFGGGLVEIRLVGDYFDATLAAAQAFAAREGATFLPPFDDADVIEGQASVGLEIIEQFPGTPDLLVVPVGGGGLSAGVVAIAAALSPATSVHLVEPLGGPSLRRALEAGAQVTLPEVDNFVDGAAVARIGDLNWNVLRRFSPEDVTLAPEGRICATMVEMLNVEGVVLEPAGALAIDALRDLGPLDGRSVVAIVSGSNFDFERLPDVKERALRWEGRKKYYILRLPQRPGALREFLSVLGPEDDISRFEYLKKSARNFGSVLLGIETTAPANFPALEARMRAAGFTWLDITEDAVITSLII